MFTYFLYLSASVLMAASYFKDKKRTILSLKKAWRSFENLLPQFLAIFMIIGMMLAILSPESISHLVGSQSGRIGMIIAALVGSITLIPGFIAFPLAAALLENGAGLMQIAVFVSTLMMVGIVTLPVEFRYFGKKATLLRNAAAFIFSFIIAMIIGGVLG